MTALVFIIALMFPPRKIDLVSQPTYYVPVQTVYGGQTMVLDGKRWHRRRTQVNPQPAAVPDHVWVQFDNWTDWSWELYRLEK